MTYLISSADAQMIIDKDWLALARCHSGGSTQAWGGRRRNSLSLPAGFKFFVSDDAAGKPDRTGASGYWVRNDGLCCYYYDSRNSLVSCPDAYRTVIEGASYLVVKDGYSGVLVCFPIGEGAGA